MITYKIETKYDGSWLGMNGSKTMSVVYRQPLAHIQELIEALDFYSLPSVLTEATEVSNKQQWTITIEDAKQGKSHTIQYSDADQAEDRNIPDYNVDALWALQTFLWNYNGNAILNKTHN